MIWRIREHEVLPAALNPSAWRATFQKNELFKWDLPLQSNAWCYCAYYRIGAEWVDHENALLVTPKDGLDEIDWPGMFFRCFETEEGVETGFGQIYYVDADATPIRDRTLQNVITPMIVAHYVSAVQRIVGKGLKQGPVGREENLRKVKGRIRFAHNLRKNLLVGRADRIYCRYEERSVDIVENQLLKAALNASSVLVRQMQSHGAAGTAVLSARLRRCLSGFDGVSDRGRCIEHVSAKRNKLYREYDVAIRLAQMILRMSDNVIDRDGGEVHAVPPFWIDMSLLYEHYVLGLLRNAYGNRILYQASVATGYPDFLYKDLESPLIIDTKYKPKYEGGWPCVDDVRQLSGYARDRSVLTKLGVCSVEAQDSAVVPCLLVFPGPDGAEAGCRKFDSCCAPHEQCTGVHNVRRLVRFHLLRIDLPRIKSR